MENPSQAHRSDPRILGRRTLERDQRILAELLRPGFAVLDVGCGTGAITAGIARAVGPAGCAVGVDRDAGLLELARQEHGGIGNLRFEEGDATALSYRGRFDVVTAARTLQWIADPIRAVVAMRQTAKPGGLVVVLDYNHTKHRWEPEPHEEFLRFYKAFLDWRRANCWDNEMVDRLPALFRAAGLVDVESHPQDEVVQRAAADFAERSVLWSQVIENVGDQIANAGFLDESELSAARVHYDAWVKSELVRQTLSMCAVTGRVAA